MCARGGFCFGAGYLRGGSLVCLAGLVGFVFGRGFAFGGLLSGFLSVFGRCGRRCRWFFVCLRRGFVLTVKRDVILNVI